MQNDIQIVNIDEAGNMYFLVSGYMNRDGTRENPVCGLLFQCHGFQHYRVPFHGGKAEL